MSAPTTSGLMKRWLFTWPVLLVCLALHLSEPVQAAEPGWITVQQAYDMAANAEVLLIDLRSPVEWRKTGVGKGAYAISMHLPDFMARLQALTGGDKTKRLALICASGVRSGIMSTALARFGYQSVVDVPEGMLGSAHGPGWLKLRLAVEPYAD